jgi:hypothetical protein
MMRQRGVFFTLGIVLLIIPLILLVVFYYSAETTKTQDTISKIRCDGLHYFVEDIRGDLSRALVIFGRRAAIYAIDEVVSTGRPLTDYAFNCSERCGLDCARFDYGMNGSTAALAELMLCGTLHGQEVPYMINHSVGQWLSRIAEHGHDMNYNVSIRVRDLRIVQEDPWSFRVSANASFDVFDGSGTCYFAGDSVMTESRTTIVGLEDPLYPLNTNAYVIKFIRNCSSPIKTEYLAGCSADAESPGQGRASGNIVFASNIDLETYCVGSAPEKINNEILVIDTGFGNCNRFEEYACFNASHPNHFAGVINYGPNSPQSFVVKCDVTIPWMMDTGDIDDIPPRSPPRTVTECGEADIFDGACVELLNRQECDQHSILLGQDSQDINTTCYYASNASFYPFLDGFDGPSFFDRLDGRLNLSEKYKSQSMEYFNTTEIGLMTLVNPYELERYGVRSQANTTWVDYLYWAGAGGCVVRGSCSTGRYEFILDDAHAYVFGLDTVCAQATGCPDSTEVCVDFVDDDGDGIPDWLDYDCLPYFAGCGTIISCEPLDGEICHLCDQRAPDMIESGTRKNCAHYGYNNTEWHFYGITPEIDGMMRVSFNGTSNVTGAQRTDLVIYNYSLGGGCESQADKRYGLEPYSMHTYCVLAGETYIMGLDVNAPGLNGYNGSYVFSVDVDSSLDCPTQATVSTTTTTTTSTTTTLCGLFDDFEVAAPGWSTGGMRVDWEMGTPSWGSAYSGQSVWATNLVGNYRRISNQWLKSPEVDLSSAADAILLYQMKYNTESNRDFVFVEASADNSDWQELEVFTGNDLSWAGHEYDLGAYAGGSVWIRFRLASDHSIQYRGAYLDDFNLSCG